MAAEAFEAIVTAVGAMSRDDMKEARKGHSNLFAEVVAWQYGKALGAEGLTEIANGFKKIVASAKVGTCPRQVPGIRASTKKRFMLHVARPPIDLNSTSPHEPEYTREHMRRG